MTALAERLAPLRLRPPDLLMMPLRLSAQKPMRVSFSRLLMSRMIAERWRIRRVSINLDPDGRGTLRYSIETPQRDLHCVVMSDRLAKEEQSDRAIATRWDLAVAVAEGPMTDDRARSIFDAPPRDGGSGSDPRFGRLDGGVLLYVCANRSSRVFDHSVDALAAGMQPDMDVLGPVSYLVRGINYVANGMMGTRMLDVFEVEHPLRGPYFAQMLGCYLLREISCDLVEAIAKMRSPRAATLDEAIRRYIGVGNSTGIGLGLMVNRHPKLVDRWLTVRESALALAQDHVPDSREVERLLNLVNRCATYRQEDETDPGFFTPSRTIAAELRAARALIEEFSTAGTMLGSVPSRPWSRLSELIEPAVAIETTETLNSLLVELDPEAASDLARQQFVDEVFDVIPDMSLSELRSIVADDYRWALDWDLGAVGQRHWLWYRTAVGGEPRITLNTGDTEDLHRNIALDLVGEIQRLFAELGRANPTETVGYFLACHPELRATTERVQSLVGLSYHSPRMNMLERDFIPIHLGRFVLWALKGMEKPSPKNNIWIRGVMMQGAPTMDQLAQGTTDDWVYPARPRLA